LSKKITRGNGRLSIGVALRRRIVGPPNKGRGVAGKEGPFGTPLKTAFPSANQLTTAKGDVIEIDRARAKQARRMWRAGNAV